MAAATADPPPPPKPRSPPSYPDLCGRRRLQLEVQMLHREIGFLEEEFQSLEGVQPVSRCCKEVNESVGAIPDPLIPINKKRRKSCRIWKWLRSKLCCCFSSICCCSGCSLMLEGLSCGCPHIRSLFCCDCLSGCPSCSCGDVSCCKPKCSCPDVSCWRPQCCCWKNLCCKTPCCCSCCDVPCCKPQCSCPTLSCPEYSCGCIWSCPRCTEYPSTNQFI